VVREIALPYLPEKELRASLGFQVQEFIPMAVDEAVLDYDPSASSSKKTAGCCGCCWSPRSGAWSTCSWHAPPARSSNPWVSTWCRLAMVRSVGTTGVGMDLEDEGDEAVIDVGAHVTNIVVHAGGPRGSCAYLPSGGRRHHAGDRPGTGDRGRPGGAFEARRRRIEQPEDVDGERIEIPAAESVRELAMQRASSFVDEIRSSLEFYTAQSQGARIARVLITGGGSKLDGFLDLLRQRIPVQVDPGQVFQRARSQLSLSPEALTEAEPLLAVAIGLAIPGRVS
jgi:type IV pilus assembly protein PilM